MNAVYDNIAAISTPLGVGGVAVIRMSGESPLKIAEKMFRPVGKTAVADFVPNVMYVGEIQGDGFTDFGMCVYFKAPKSFTGEDSVEFHCHGGVAIARGILKEAFRLGARPATKGEFTRRAFLNGKMSLSSCEGLIDMINSESVAEVKAGYYLYREKLTAAVVNLQNRLTYALAFINAGIDYPEENVVEDNYDEVAAAIKEVSGGIADILSRYGKGRKIKHGVRVGIFGKPNTGKSSLLNALLDYDKAIVSDVAGTTRDVVEGEIDIDGVRFLLFDTAGIRDSEDVIESVGVDKAKRIITESDVCVVVLDGSKKLEKEDIAVLRQTENMNRIIIANKSDLGIRAEGFDLAVSAVHGDNLGELKKLLVDKTMGKIDLSGDFLTEERHYAALSDALALLKDAEKNFDVNTPELVAFDLDAAWKKLGEISGETASEAIVDEIFSKFCVGK